MTNANNSESRASSKAKTGRTLYDVGTLDDGTIVIKRIVVPATSRLVADAKAKDAKAPNVRVTE